MQNKIIALSFIALLIGDIVIAQSSMGESGSGFLTSLPPGAPLLYRPADKAVDLQDTISVIWHPQIHAASYTLQISAAIDFSTPVISQTALADTIFSAPHLENNTSYFWRVSASNIAGVGLFSDVWSFTTTTFSAVDRIIRSIPNDYALLPAYPNPFNPMTTIAYHLPEESDISLVIYNSMGQQIQELVSGHRQAGTYMISWDGRNNRGAPVTSGLYI